MIHCCSGLVLPWIVHCELEVDLQHSAFQVNHQERMLINPSPDGMHWNYCGLVRLYPDIHGTDGDSLDTVSSGRCLTLDLIDTTYDFGRISCTCLDGTWDFYIHALGMKGEWNRPSAIIGQSNRIYSISPKIPLGGWPVRQSVDDDSESRMNMNKGLKRT